MKFLDRKPKHPSEGAACLGCSKFARLPRKGMEATLTTATNVRCSPVHTMSPILSELLSKKRKGGEEREAGGIRLQAQQPEDNLVLAVAHGQPDVLEGSLLQCWGSDWRPSNVLEQLITEGKWLPKVMRKAVVSRSNLHLLWLQANRRYQNL